jgi:hypothetical protein
MKQKTAIFDILMSSTAVVAVQQCSNAMTQYRNVSKFKNEGCGRAGSDLRA